MRSTPILSNKRSLRRVLPLLGLVSFACLCVLPKQALAEGAAEELPASPLEAEWQRLEASEQTPAGDTAPQTSEPYTRLILAAGFDWMSRQSRDETLATYQAGPAAGIDATVCLLPWLGVRLGFREEWHTSELHRFSSLDLQRDKSFLLQGLQLSASLEPRWSINRYWSLFGGIGIAWARLGAKAMTLDTVEGTAAIHPRTTVLVEMPISLGASYAIFPNLLQVAVRGRYIPHIIRQTGDFVDGGAGSGQVVSNSGHRLTISGLPKFDPGLSLGLALELLL
jgi:opacity protein-like surface antigen